MITAMLLPLLAVSAPHPTPKMGLPLADPPVKVWLNDDRFERGDKARVYVKADRDGYVVVLHAEPDGRVRVLFPLDPTDDDYIKAGDTYEVRGRGDRNAFTVYDTRGEGVVFAAFSPDPFKFDAFVRQDHWDYRVDAFRVGDDAEADLTELARQMAAQAEFEYDLVRYDVSQHVAYGSSYYPYSYPSYYSGWYDPWYRPWRSGIYLSIGSPWYYSCWYCDPWYYDPWYSSYYYHTAWYRPYYYDPYRWDPWYQPYGYRTSVVYSSFRNYYGYRYGWNGYRSPTYGQQRYGFNYVQPGRRALSLYAPDQSPVDARRRVLIPPTDIVAPAVALPRVRDGAEPGSGAGAGVGQAPGRRVNPDVQQPARGTPARGVSEPSRRVQPSRPARDPRGLVPIRDAREPTPRTDSDRSRSLREVSPTERQPMAPERRSVDERTRKPGQYTPTRPESGDRPQLERRSPERRDPPSRAQPSEPRMREPRASPSRPSSPPRMSSPPRSGGMSAPRAAPRSGGGGGGGGGRSMPSSPRRRG